MFKACPKRLQGVIYSLGFSFGKVAICLYFSLDVLKFGLELLFGLYALHEHDIVVTVHLHKLVVHVFKRLIVVLHSGKIAHIFLNELLLDWRHGLVMQVLFRTR